MIVMENQALVTGCSFYNGMHKSNFATYKISFDLVKYIL